MKKHDTELVDGLKALLVEVVNQLQRFSNGSFQVMSVEKTSNGQWGIFRPEAGQPLSLQIQQPG